MTYQYTVFQTSAGYTWSSDTPEKYRTLERFLGLCERNQEIFIFFDHHAFQIRHTVNTLVQVRTSECYDVTDFPDALTKADNENGIKIIRNFLSGRTDVLDGIIFDEKFSIMGSLEYFARHLPGRVLKDIIIDVKPAKAYRENTAFFFRPAANRFLDNDLSLEWVPELPFFKDEYDNLYTALWYAKGQQHYLSILTFIIRADACILKKNTYDKNIEYLNYLKFLFNKTLMQEAGQKFGFDLRPETLISPELAENIITHCPLTDMKLFQNLPLLWFYHVDDRTVLRLLRLYPSEPNFLPDTPPPDGTDIRIAFLNACEQHTNTQCVLNFADYRQLAFIVEYCIENKLPVLEIENHISTKDKTGKDTVIFLQWFSGDQKKPIQDADNLIPVIAVLYGSKFIDRAVCLKFYGSKQKLRKAEKKIDMLCMPLEYRNISQVRLGFLIKKALSRFLGLRQSQEKQHKV